jgi:hypothetical protein
MKLWQRVAMGSLCTTAVGGCASVGMFDAVTSAEIAHHDMRVMRSDMSQIYYASTLEPETLVVSRRLDKCLARLRRLTGARHSPARVVIHDGELNNAYVSIPMAGASLAMVSPMHMSVELFNLFGQGVVDLDDAICHEAVHYAMSEADEGMWRYINRLAGPFFSPAAFFPDWLSEGMATYYESHLGKATGRSINPLWHGTFAAGLHGPRRLRLSDMHMANRTVAGIGSPAYLVGSHFVAFLAERYGEAKLWEVIRRQNASVISMFGVNQRLAAPYGKSLDELFDEFVAASEERFSVRPRPMGQTVELAEVGAVSRLAVCRSGGCWAVVGSGPGRASRLRMFDAHGAQIWSRRLVDTLPPRDATSATARTVSGMSFGPGGDLYLTLASPARDGGYQSELWRLDGTTGNLQQRWPHIQGVGGDVSPDGRTYAFIAIERNEARLASLTLATGEVRTLYTAGVMRSMGAPAFSPSGASIAFAAKTDEGFNIFVRRDTGEVVPLTGDDAFNYQPRWLDEDTIIFNRGVGGRLQAHSVDITSMKMRALTDAPYAVLDVFPWRNNRILFLSAEGWSWNVESVEHDHEQMHREPTMAMAPRQPLSVSEAERARPSVTGEVYSQVEGLATPQLFMPWLSVSGPGDALFTDVGVTLLGRDTLGYHRYHVVAGYHPRSASPNVRFAYLNAHSSPWTVLLGGTWADNAWQAWSPHPTWISDRSLYVMGSRAYWGTWRWQGGLVGRQRLTEAIGTNTFSWGPAVALAFEAGERTAHGGDAFWISAEGGIRAALTKSSAGAETAVDVTVQTPLPLSRRHSLTFTGTARQMLGATGALIDVAGTADGRANARNRAEPPSGPTFAHQTLAVRGHADATFSTHRFIGGEVTYNYPIILDYGWSTAALVLDEPFLRQINLQVFGAAGSGGPDTQEARWLRAVGSSVRLHAFLLSGLPLAVNIGWQSSYRFDGRRPWEHLFIAGFG